MQLEKVQFNLLEIEDQAKKEKGKIKNWKLQHHCYSDEKEKENKAYEGCYYIYSLKRVC